MKMVENAATGAGMGAAEMDKIKNLAKADARKSAEKG